MYGPQHDPRYKFPDIVHATFQFESGALATITGGFSYPIHKFRESQGPWGECEHGGFKMVPYLDHAYRLETSDFVRCVEMMEAAYRSAESGGQPVELPLYPELEGE